MTIRKAPATPAVAMEIAKARSLTRNGIDAHQAQRERVLSDREHRASEEGVREEQLQADHHDHGHEEGNDQAHRKPTSPAAR